MSDEKRESTVDAKQSTGEPQRERRQIKIGSQREQARPLPPILKRDELKSTPTADDESTAGPMPETAASPTEAPSTAPTPASAESAPPTPPQPAEEKPAASEPAAQEEAATQKKYPLPNIRQKLPADLEAELEAAMGDLSVEELLSDSVESAVQAELEPESRHRGRVVAIHQENVFFDLGGRNQGVAPLKQFAEPPEIGTVVDLLVHRFDPEEGLYELTLPGAALDVGDWSQISEGLVVEARVTGHNKGGLECEVGGIRGFIPASQISLYRVDDLEQFVGEKFACVVTEAKPERRNLVLSRRAVLEREQEAAKQKLLAELAPGQVREGTVRNIRDFGAFVDLGGVDGLLHVSQLSWARVKHPGDLLQVGQAVKVKILKVDPDTHKISLGMRDLFENPWDKVPSKYPPRTTIRGRVSKIMDFGAFVELEPGVEGLVHISELSHRRVWRTTDIVSEGQEVEAQVVSVDADNQRISLSMKALEAKAPPAQTAEPEDEEPEAPPAPKKKQVALRGGREGTSGGDQFGLKW